MLWPIITPFRKNNKKSGVTELIICLEGQNLAQPSEISCIILYQKLKIEHSRHFDDAPFYKVIQYLLLKRKKKKKQSENMCPPRESTLGLWFHRLIRLPLGNKSKCASHGGSN